MPRIPQHIHTPGSSNKRGLASIQIMDRQGAALYQEEATKHQEQTYTQTYSPNQQSFCSFEIARLPITACSDEKRRHPDNHYGVRTMLTVNRPGLPPIPRHEPTPTPPPRSESLLPREPSPPRSPAMPSTGKLTLHPQIEEAAQNKQAETNAKMAHPETGGARGTGSTPLEPVYENLSRSIGSRSPSLLERALDRSGRVNHNAEPRSTTSEHGDANRSHSARPGNVITRLFSAIRDFFTQCFRPRNTDNPYPAHNSTRASQPAVDPGLHYAQIDHGGRGPGPAPAAQSEPGVEYAELRL